MRYSMSLSGALVAVLLAGPAAGASIEISSLARQSDVQVRTVSETGQPSEAASDRATSRDRGRFNKQISVSATASDTGSEEGVRGDATASQDTRVELNDRGLSLSGTLRSVANVVDENDPSGGQAFPVSGSELALTFTADKPLRVQVSGAYDRHGYQPTSEITGLREIGLTRSDFGRFEPPTVGPGEGTFSARGRLAAGEHTITAYADTTELIGGGRPPAGPPPNQRSEMSFQIQARVVPSPSAAGAGVLLLGGLAVFGWRARRRS